MCSLNELVGQALDGFSVTIFAFGQTGEYTALIIWQPCMSYECIQETPVQNMHKEYFESCLCFTHHAGSGKTHTMVGPRLSRGAAVSASGTAVTCDKDDGLLPRCLAAAWQGMEQRQSQRKFKVTSTCVELYNEAATDLLGENKAKQLQVLRHTHTHMSENHACTSTDRLTLQLRSFSSGKPRHACLLYHTGGVPVGLQHVLQVRKDERGGFRVDGLSHVECSSAGSALQAMSKALIHRHTRAHALNEYSSRSHCLMTFHFDSQEEGEGKEEGAKGGVRR